MPPRGVHAAKETLDEKARERDSNGPFDTGYAGVKETAKRDATPTIATRSSGAYDTLIEEAPGLDARPMSLAPQLVFKTANQLQNATISPHHADSLRCLRTADDTSPEIAFAVAFR
jgi:hypothetical protein